MYLVHETTGRSKSLCAPDDYNTEVRCRETFWSPCSTWPSDVDDGLFSLRPIIPNVRRHHIENVLIFLPTIFSVHYLIRTRYRYELSGPGSSVGIATELRVGRSGGSNPGGGEIFRACPDRSWGSPSLLCNGYRLFSGGKVRLGRAADHSPPSSAKVMEE
jgi:hypothetical protein